MEDATANPEPRRRILRASFLILATTAGATLLRAALDPLLGGTAQFVTFFVSIVICGVLIGSAAALITTALSVICVTVFFIEPRWGATASFAPDIVALGMFACAGSVIAWISGSMHAARHDARSRADQLAGALEQLSRGEQRLRAMFNHAGVGMVEVDRDDRLIAANDRFCRILGYRSDELLGKTVNEITAPEDRPLSDELNSRLHNGTLGHFSYEKRYTRCDGSPVWVHVTVSAVRGVDGQWLRSVATIEDISERKATEDALRESERRFRLIVETSPFPKMIHAEDGSVLAVNPAWAKLSGYPREQISTVDAWTMKAYGPRAAQVKAQIQKTYDLDRMVHQGEFVITAADGQQRIWDFYSGPLGNDELGRRLIVSTATDVTQRKNTEQALRESEQRLQAATLAAEQAREVAEQASRSKDHFLAVLSHELRTPLTAVIPALEALGNAVTGEHAEYLEMARRNVELEARLIDDLLDVTRIARGKIELDRHPVRLDTLLRRAAEVCLPDVEARRLHLGTDLEDGQPLLIYADAARLQQVFWNVLKNAVKFTPHGGCVGIRAWQEDDRAIVEVTDSGVGIEPQAIERIFNAFEQGERTLSRRFGGLGLGLAISRALVEMHGGKIEARSEGREKGATFRIELPLAAAATAYASPAPASASAPGSLPASTAHRGALRILFVEDHGDTARILGRLLRVNGYEVEHAGDVATALEAARRQRFDLLISDLGLPDGTGYDLIKELRGRGSRFPAIAVSGYGTTSDLDASKHAGFCEHLTKPISVAALEEAIRRTVAASIPTSAPPDAMSC